MLPNTYLWRWRGRISFVCRCPVEAAEAALHIWGGFQQSSCRALTWPVHAPIHALVVLDQYTHPPMLEQYIICTTYVGMSFSLYEYRLSYMTSTCSNSWSAHTPRMLDQYMSISLAQCMLYTGATSTLPEHAPVFHALEKLSQNKGWQRFQHLRGGRGWGLPLSPPLG